MHGRATANADNDTETAGVTASDPCRAAAALPLRRPFLSCSSPSLCPHAEKLALTKEVESLRTTIGRLEAEAQRQAGKPSGALAPTSTPVTAVQKGKKRASQKAVEKDVQAGAFPEDCSRKESSISSFPFLTYKTGKLTSRHLCDSPPPTFILMTLLLLMQVAAPTSKKKAKSTTMATQTATPKVPDITATVATKDSLLSRGEHDNLINLTDHGIALLEELLKGECVLWRPQV